MNQTGILRMNMLHLIHIHRPNQIQNNADINSKKNNTIKKINTKSFSKKIKKK